MLHVLQSINAFVWGVPALLLILVSGIRLTVSTGFAQLRMFPAALRLFVKRLSGDANTKDGVSPFQSLCTALAATVGTGNIAGVAGAICIGGPGAVFWLWVSAALGMVIKFAEVTLAMHYQQTDPKGGCYGGPMHMIEQGMGRRYRYLAVLYCCFGVIAAFGIGNATQVNAVIVGINEAVGWSASKPRDLLIGAVLALLTCVILLGGAKRIGEVAQMLIPFAAVAYILLGTGVVIAHYRNVPGVMKSIFTGAFSPAAVTGGMVGSFFTTLRTGISRGIFTNEAGMGTASMSYAGARVAHPVEQGLMGIVEVFIDTVVICTITALAILCSGVPISYGMDEGAALTARAFSRVYGTAGKGLLAAFLCCFAFATMLGWGLYGVRCAQFLFGERAWKPFVYLQTCVITLSSVLGTGTVWLLAETMNGLMAIPNLIAVLFLSPVLLRLMRCDSNYKGGSAADGGTNESFYQCQSLRTLSHEKIPSLCGGSGTPGKADLSFEHRSARR